MSLPLCLARLARLARTSATLGLLAMIGCGSSSSSTSPGSDGGIGAGCPDHMPAPLASCALADGTRCGYGCDQGGPGSAICQGGAWTVYESDQACPAAAAGCHGDADCTTQGTYCATSSPGGITYCGSPLDPTCSVDADCADAGPGGYVCENFMCPSGAGRGCFPRCTDAACGPTTQTGLVCGASGRCEAKTCNAAADCPTNFDCDAGRCQRRTCTADAECQGYCVNKTCRDALGSCEQPRG